MLASCQTKRLELYQRIYIRHGRAGEVSSSFDYERAASVHKTRSFKLAQEAPVLVPCVLSARYLPWLTRGFPVAS